MKVLLHSRAFKHGLSREEILYAFENGRGTAVTRARDLGRIPPSWAVLGCAPNGRLVEIVATTCNQGVLIFHANWATKNFIREVTQAGGMGND